MFVRVRYCPEQSGHLVMLEQRPGIVMHQCTYLEGPSLVSGHDFIVESFRFLFVRILAPWYKVHVIGK